MPKGPRKLVRPIKALAKTRKRKELATERKFPHIVEIVLPAHGLDVHA